MTYGDVLQEILDFELTGVMYSWERNTENPLDDENWTELPPDKFGYRMNLLSFKVQFVFDRERFIHLPRKKKKKLAMHFNKKYNKLKRFVDAMEE